MRTSDCKGCGKKIIWAFIVKAGVRTGKRVPLDPRPVVYRMAGNGGFDASEYEAEALLQVNGMVNHFATCPNASKF